MSFFLHMKKHNKKLHNYSKITGSLGQVQNPKLCSPQMVMYPEEGPQRVGARILSHVILLKLGYSDLKSALNSECEVTIIVKCKVIFEQN